MFTTAPVRTDTEYEKMGKSPRISRYDSKKNFNLR